MNEKEAHLSVVGQIVVRILKIFEVFGELVEICLRLLNLSHRNLEGLGRFQLMQMIIFEGDFHPGIRRVSGSFTVEN